MSKLQFTYTRDSGLGSITTNKQTITVRLSPSCICKDIVYVVVKGYVHNIKLDFVGNVKDPSKINTKPYYFIDKAKVNVEDLEEYDFDPSWEYIQGYIPRDDNWDKVIEYLNKHTRSRA